MLVMSRRLGTSTLILFCAACITSGQHATEWKDLGLNNAMANVRVTVKREDQFYLWNKDAPKVDNPPFVVSIGKWVRLEDVQLSQLRQPDLRSKQEDAFRIHTYLEQGHKAIEMFQFEVSGQIMTQQIDYGAPSYAGVDPVDLGFRVYHTPVSKLVRSPDAKDNVSGGLPGGVELQGQIDASNQNFVSQSVANMTQVGLRRRTTGTPALVQGRVVPNKVEEKLFTVQEDKEQLLMTTTYEFSDWRFDQAKASDVLLDSLKRGVAKGDDDKFYRVQADGSLRPADLQKTTDWKRIMFTGSVALCLAGFFLRLRALRL